MYHKQIINNLMPDMLVVHASPKTGGFNSPVGSCLFPTMHNRAQQLSPRNLHFNKNPTVYLESFGGYLGYPVIQMFQNMSEQGDNLKG